MIPLASEADAAGAVADVQDRFVRNPLAQVRVASEKAMPEVEIPGTSATWGYEQTLTGTWRRCVPLLGGATGSVVFIVVASGFDDAWTWDQVKSLAEVIVGRSGTA